MTPYRTGSAVLGELDFFDPHETKKTPGAGNHQNLRSDVFFQSLTFGRRKQFITSSDLRSCSPHLLLIMIPSKYESFMKRALCEPRFLSILLLLYMFDEVDNKPGRGNKESILTGWCIIRRNYL